MGAIVAVSSQAGAEAAARRVREMAEVSPYRGELEVMQVGTLALGLQSLGWDASLAEEAGLVCAVHGKVDGEFSVGGTRPLFYSAREGNLALATEVGQVRAALGLEPAAPMGSGGMNRLPLSAPFVSKFAVSKPSVSPGARGVEISSAGEGLSLPSSRRSGRYPIPGLAFLPGMGLSVAQILVPSGRFGSLE